MERFLKIKDISRQTGLSKTTILKLINEGKLEGFKVGNIYVVKESEFERYLQSVSSRKGFRAAEQYGFRTGAQALIGETGLVVEPVVPFTGGRVYVKGSLWRAYAPEGERIEASTPVTIERIEGVSLYIRRKER